MSKTETEKEKAKKRKQQQKENRKKRRRVRLTICERSSLIHLDKRRDLSSRSEDKEDRKEPKASQMEVDAWSPLMI